MITTMVEKSKTRTVTLCGEVYVDVIVGEGADGETEIQNVHSVSMMIGRPGKSIHVDIAKDYSGISCRSVAEKVIEKSDTLIALIAEQDKAEAQQAEQDAAEDMDNDWHCKWESHEFGDK